MMKHKCRVVMHNLVVGVLAALMTCVAFAAEGDPLGYALLIQQSPAEGGTVSPGLGVHKISIGQSVELSATPRPGYRFLYWLGDVSAMSTSVTSVSLDSPKMVVAVFERESFEEDLLGGAGPVVGGGGGRGRGGLRSSPYPMTSPGPTSIGAYSGDVKIVYSFDYSNGNNGGTEEDYTNGVAGPGGNTNTPEPTTAILLGLGAAALLRKRK